MAELERLLVRLEADTTQMRRAMSQAERGVGQFERRSSRALRRFNQSMAGVGRSVTNIALGMGTALAGIFSVQAAAGAIRYADQLGDAADRVGVSIEGLQALRFTGAEFGIADNTVDMALQRFSRRLGEAANGTGELLPMLERMGISARGANGELRTSESVLMDYADAVAAMDSPNERLLASFKAFDSEGAAMVSALAQGSAGLRTYEQAARDAGVVLDENLVRQGQQASRTFEVLGMQFRTQFATAVLESSDDLETLANNFATLVPVVVQVTNAVVGLVNAIARLGDGPRRAEQITGMDSILDDMATGDLRNRRQIRTRLFQELPRDQASQAYGMISEFPRQNGGRSEFFTDESLAQIYDLLSVTNQARAAMEELQTLVNTPTRPPVVPVTMTRPGAGGSGGTGTPASAESGAPSMVAWLDRMETGLEAVRRKMDEMKLPPELSEEMQELETRMEAAREAAERFGADIGQAVAAPIGAALVKMESLRDVLESIARNVASVLARRFVEEPLQNAIGDMVGGSAQSTTLAAGVTAGATAGALKLGGSITTAGAGAATSIGTAMTTAGSSVAAQIAAAMAAGGSGNTGKNLLKTIITAGVTGGKGKAAPMTQGAPISVSLSIDARGSTNESVDLLRRDVDRIPNLVADSVTKIMRERQRRGAGLSGIGA